MRPFIIQAWIEEVEASIAHEMPSPTKRPRTSDVLLDPDRTPTRPQHQARVLESDEAVFDDAVSAQSKPSSFTEALSLIPPVSAPTSLPTRSATGSPSKQFRTTRKLRDLAIPVNFVKEPDPESALPEDAQVLYKELSAVENREGIIPEALRGHADFRRVRGFMWKPSSESEPELLANHAQLRKVIASSTYSAECGRDEFGWNNFVHTPLLVHTLSSFNHIDIQTIMAARILPAFRPLTKGGDVASISGASSASGQDPGTPQTEKSAAAPVGIHKMVDYAILLRPNQDLESSISTFLARQSAAMATINQTRYEPLRTSPAPVFIETKTASGNMETANVQLGIWVAAWHQRMRSIIEYGRENERVITIPVLQVVGSVWSLLFVVDKGTNISVIDWSCRIGDTDTVIGVYQLQAAMHILGKWIKDKFEPWFTKILSRAIS